MAKMFFRLSILCFRQSETLTWPRADRRGVMPPARDGTTSLLSDVIVSLLHRFLHRRHRNHLRLTAGRRNLLRRRAAELVRVYRQLLRQVAPAKHLDRRVRQADQTALTQHIR